MRRFLRILLDAATVLSLVLCVAIVLWWVRASWVHDWIAFSTPGGRFVQVNSPTFGRHAVEITYVRNWPVRQSPVWIAGKPDIWIQYGLASRPGFGGFRRYERFGLEFIWGEGFALADDNGPLLRFYNRSPVQVFWGVTSDTPLMPFAGATLPYWFLVCLTGLAPATRLASVALRKRRRVRRSKRGRCADCGYDLRATPDRCPECGTVPTTR